MYAEKDVSTRLELDIPMFTKRENFVYEIDFFTTGETLEKIYFSKSQNKKILNQIKNNDNWKRGDLDKRLEEKINNITYGLYGEIPKIKDKYWFVTKARNIENDSYNLDEIVSKDYLAFCVGIYDYKNAILYYYSYL